MKRIKLEINFNGKTYRSALNIKSSDTAVVNYAKNRLIKHLYKKVSTDAGLKDNFSIQSTYITPEMNQNYALQDAIDEAFEKSNFIIENINE